MAFARALRLSVSPGALRDYMRMNLDVDVRGVLDSIRVPTLVLHRTELARLDIRGARYLAEHIRGARLVELPGRNFAPAVGDAEALFAEIERFCADIKSGGWEPAEPDRMLATVLFTDIVGSTNKMAELGDRGWREFLDRAPHCYSPPALTLPRHRDGHCRRRLLRPLRRPGTCGPLRAGDH